VFNLYICADPQARMLFSSRVTSDLVSGVPELNLEAALREAEETGKN
jgi:hypothetical protein